MGYVYPYRHICEQVISLCNIHTFVGKLFSDNATLPLIFWATKKPVLNRRLLQGYTDLVVFQQLLYYRVGPKVVEPIDVGSCLLLAGDHSKARLPACTAIKLFRGSIAPVPALLLFLLLSCTWCHHPVFFW